MSGGRRAARALTAGVVRYSGAPWLVRHAYARTRATILLYHDPAPEVMERHLRYLADRFAFTTLDLVVEALVRGSFSELPRGALVLTFDDGHQGNFALLPLFRRFAVRPTIYVCSQIVGTRRRFWFQEPVASGPLKRVANRERLSGLRAATGFEQEREHRDTPPRALTLEQMREMADAVDFGSHTRFHPILPRCEEDEALQEIAGSRADLERLLQRPVRHFAFPNGDYCARDLELVRGAGYASARTTEVGWVRPGEDRFRLPILGISDDASVTMLAAQLTGLANRLRRWIAAAPATRSAG